MNDDGVLQIPDPFNPPEAAHLCVLCIADGHWRGVGRGPLDANGICRPCADLFECGWTEPGQ